MVNFKSSFSVAMLFCVSFPAFSEDIKYDKSVAEAAANKAADKVGDLRPSIDYDQKVIIVKENSKAKSTIDENAAAMESQRITSLANEKLELLAQVNKDKPADIDYRATGSVNADGPRYVNTIIWEKFDMDGNPID